MQTQLVRTGITRNVLLWRNYAIKVPKRKYIRGWLANQSEWRRRKVFRVNPPIFTLFHFVAVYRRAYQVLHDETGLRFGCCPHHEGYDISELYDGDEAKTSSWGIFINPTHVKYLLIDYDRAWENPRGIVCRLYYWNQARLARRWMKLPEG